jgi:hypothetical protein
VVRKRHEGVVGPAGEGRPVGTRNTEAVTQWKQTDIKCYGLSLVCPPGGHLLKGWLLMQQWSEVGPLECDRIMKAVTSSMD